MRFICPECKAQKLEQVMTGVIATVEVTHIDEDGDHDYGIPTLDEGYVSRYQCSHCGFVLYKDECEIADVLELVEWIKENCKLERKNNA